MLTDTEHFALFGTLSREDQGRRLGAGALEATLKDGNLATIRYLGHEVLRAIAFLVRDRDWGTCAPAISDLVIDEADDHFRLTYTAVFTAPTGARLPPTACSSVRRSIASRRRPAAAGPIARRSPTSTPPPAPPSRRHASAAA